MCRNIKKLRRPDEEPTDAELHDASLQFVRKISGFRVPSTANKEAFDSAVEEIAHAARHLFDHLEVRPHHHREKATDHSESHHHPHGQAVG